VIDLTRRCESQFCLRVDLIQSGYPFQMGPRGNQMGTEGMSALTPLQFPLIRTAGTLWPRSHKPVVSLKRIHASADIFLERRRRMFRILDKDQPVIVYLGTKYHSPGWGACESSWGWYGSIDTLRVAEVGGYSACENCRFEKVNVGKLLRKLLTAWAPSQCNIVRQPRFRHSRLSAVSVCTSPPHKKSRL
jgi:hypothetical protein